MNPSAPGWILKKLHTFNQNSAPLQLAEEEFYKELQKTGFIYGVSVTPLFIKKPADLEMTELELAKANLFDALLYIYFKTTHTLEGFVKTVILFYKNIDDKRRFFSTSILKKKSPEDNLERLLQERIQTGESIIQKNFSHIITNALLFLDVLSFSKYLKEKEGVLAYASNLEALLMYTIWLGLTKKEDKGTYDNLLLKLFEKSLRYNRELLQTDITLNDLQYNFLETSYEKNYLLDLACLAVWDDNQLDKNEYLYIEDLGKKLNLSPQIITQSTRHVHFFINANKEKISFINYDNPVKQFYNQASRSIKILILRNKKRLLKEILESKELVILLGQSTLRELDKNEKLKVKTQLLDVCKSIPSLAIFLLPGGGVLLPLLIKFIPELLPTAFNDNKIENQRDVLEKKNNK